MGDNNIPEDEWDAGHQEAMRKLAVTLTRIRESAANSDDVTGFGKVITALDDIAWTLGLTREAHTVIKYAA